jgi:excisionase family DNA binding protein
MPAATALPETPSLRVLTAAEVAAILRVDRNELYAKLRAGTMPFPAHRIGSKWVIPARPFERWLDGESTDDAA